MFRNNILRAGFLLLAVAALAAAGCGPAADGTPAGESLTKAEFVPGEIVVEFADNTTDEVITAAITQIGGEIKERSKITPTRVVLSVPEGKEGEFVEAYRELDVVKAADKNYRIKAFGGASDAVPLD